MSISAGDIDKADAESHPCPSIPDNAPAKSESSPIKVYISYKINYIADINVLTSSFMCDIKVFYKWNDPFLIGRKKDSSIDFKEKGVFYPDIEVQNAFDIIETSVSSKLVDSTTGEIKLTACYKGTFFITAMSLQLFPFDCQNLQLTFRPHKLNANNLQIIAMPAVDSAMERSITHEWDVLNHCCIISLTDPAASSTNKSYSSASIIILVRRKSGWFVSNIFIPTFLLLMISWLTFLYSVDSRSDRNDISMATLLASIGNKYVVSDQLPKVDYRTLVDVYVECCFILQAMSVFATAAVTYWSDMNISYCDGYITLNSILFTVEFLIFLFLHDWIHIRLHNHEIDINKWLDESRRANKGTECMDDDSVAEVSKKSSALGILTSVYLKLMTDRRTFLSTKAAANYNYEKHPEDHVDSFGITGHDSFLNFGVKPKESINSVINSEKRRKSIDSLNREKNLVLQATAAAIVDEIKFDVARHNCRDNNPDTAATLIMRVWKRYKTLRAKKELIQINKERREIEEANERDRAARVITVFFRRAYISRQPAMRFVASKPGLRRSHRIEQATKIRK